MKRLWHILRSRVPDEAISYAAIPLFAWWWVDTVLSYLEMYSLGADQPSVLDFVAPCIIFALWVFTVIWAWHYLRHRIQKWRDNHRLQLTGDARDG